jgi:hypothetical protein
MRKRQRTTVEKCSGTSPIPVWWRPADQPGFGGFAFRQSRLILKSDRAIDLGLTKNPGATKSENSRQEPDQHAAKQQTR